MAAAVQRELDGGLRSLLPWLPLPLLEGRVAAAPSGVLAPLLLGGRMPAALRIPQEPVIRLTTARRHDPISASSSWLRVQN